MRIKQKFLVWGTNTSVVVSAGLYLNVTYCKSFSEETPLIHWCCCMLRSFTYFIWFSAWFSFLNFTSVLMQAPQMWADLLILKRKEKKEHLCAFSNDLKKNLNFSSWLDQIFFWLLLLFPDLPSLIYFFSFLVKNAYFLFFLSYPINLISIAAAIYSSISNLSSLWNSDCLS